VNDKITAVVLTSPVVSNPLTNTIDETLDSIRYHLPLSQIFVLADGVRKEEERRRLNYMTYLGYLANMLVTKYEPAYFAVSHKHLHQVGMMRGVINRIQTPLILFMEHDTPLEKRPIEWKELVDILLDEKEPIEYIRFNPEASIPTEHNYLMVGEVKIGEVSLMRTLQFHARPHLATVNFYKRALAKFSPQANCFIEDKMHSVCQCEGYSAWPMAIYTPLGDQKRSRHLDARDSAKKYDDEQIF
jgi:hypothetical protein